MAEEAPKKGLSAAWVALTSKLEAWVEDTLAGLAYFAATRSCLTVSLCLMTTLILGCGVLQIKSETKADQLWVPQRSTPMLNNLFVEAHYTADSRYSAVVAHPKQGDNMLTVETMAEFVGFLEELKATKTPSGLGFEDLCSRNPVTGQCRTAGIVLFWGNSKAQYETLVTDQASLLATVSRETWPNGAPVARLDAMMSPTINETDNSVLAARGVRALFLTNGCYPVASSQAECQDEEPLAWEKAFLAKAKEHSSMVALLDAQRVIDDELGETIFADMPLVAATYVLMVTYTCLVMGQCDAVKSRAALGYAAVGSVLASTLAGYGLAMMWNIPFTSLQQLLPFILLGIGIDDAFIIVNAYDSTNEKLPIPDRCALALRRCGMSITLTSLTDACAFLLGASTELPAVSHFCYYACFSITIDFMFQVSMFVAFLAMDERRQAARRMDCFCCIQRPALPKRQSPITPRAADATPKPAKKAPRLGADGNPAYSRSIRAAHEEFSKESWGRRFMRNHYAPFLMKKPVKVLVLLGFAALFASCVWGVTKVGGDFDVVDLTRDDSNARLFFDTVAELTGPEGNVFGGVASIGLYVKAVKYHEPIIQHSISMFEKNVDNSEYTTGPAESWLQSFLAWLPQQPAWAPYLTSGGLFDGTTSPAARQAFYTALAEFLARPQAARFRSDIAWKDNSMNSSVIVTSRTWNVFRQLPHSEEELAALEDVERISKAAGHALPGSFVFTFQFLFWEQHRVIRPELMTNFGLCLVAVCIICAVILVHPFSVLLLAAVVTVIDTDLLGTLYFWGLDLNTISVINLVMAVGLVVDFSAHIIHNFSLQDPRLSADDRVIATMAEMGPAVIMGGFTTFLGVLPVIFSTSEVFRVFFRCFFSIVVYGVGHGVILVPVVLSLVPGMTGHRSVSEFRQRRDSVSKISDGEKARRELAEHAAHGAAAIA